MCEENSQLSNEDNITEDSDKADKPLPLGKEFIPTYISDDEVSWWIPPHIDRE